MPMVRAATKELPLEAVWVSKVCAATENHVKVHDPGYCWLLRGEKLLLQWYQ